MTRNKLALLISLVVGLVVVAGGIVYAQEAAAPMALDDQEPPTADRSFSILLGGGAQFVGSRL